MLESCASPPRPTASLRARVSQVLKWALVAVTAHSCASSPEKQCVQHTQRVSAYLNLERQAYFNLK